MAQPNKGKKVMLKAITFAALIKSNLSKSTLSGYLLVNIEIIKGK